jgi:TRAP-type C4-dicarboxylate transport system substrate-binding protein
MKIGTPGAPTDTMAATANWVKERVKEVTKGRVEVKVFPASQLGNNVHHIWRMCLFEWRLLSGFHL